MGNGLDADWEGVWVKAIAVVDERRVRKTWGRGFGLLCSQAGLVVGHCSFFAIL